MSLVGHNLPNERACQKIIGGEGVIPGHAYANRMFLRCKGFFIKRKKINLEKSPKIIFNELKKNSYNQNSERRNDLTLELK